ncbi:MAG: hypothetical protein U0T74_09910 [Chitinophagales bacterium]
MKKTNLKSALLTLTVFLILTGLLNSCKPKCERHPEDPECAGENELITTLKVTFTDSATGNAAGVFQFKDADGNGSPEIFDTIRLAANKTYRAELQFLNESVSPAENITDEIEAENNDHFIAYHAHTLTITFTYIDFDSNTPSLPVGLQTYWQTGPAATGTAHITLRHQPGVKDGTETPGDTDAEVEFPVILQ